MKLTRRKFLIVAAGLAAAAILGREKIKEVVYEVRYGRGVGWTKGKEVIADVMSKILDKHYKDFKKRNTEGLFELLFPSMLLFDYIVSNWELIKNPFPHGNWQDMKFAIYLGDEPLKGNHFAFSHAIASAVEFVVPNIGRTDYRTKDNYTYNQFQRCIKSTPTYSWVEIWLHPEIAKPFFPEEGIGMKNAFGIVLDPLDAKVGGPGIYYIGNNFNAYKPYYWGTWGEAKKAPKWEYMEIFGPRIYSRYLIEGIAALALWEQKYQCKFVIDIPDNLKKEIKKNLGKIKEAFWELACKGKYGKLVVGDLCLEKCNGKMPDSEKDKYGGWIGELCSTEPGKKVPIGIYGGIAACGFCTWLNCVMKINSSLHNYIREIYRNFGTTSQCPKYCEIIGTDKPTDLGRRLGRESWHLLRAYGWVYNTERYNYKPLKEIMLSILETNRDEFARRDPRLGDLIDSCINMFSTRVEWYAPVK